MSSDEVVRIEIAKAWNVRLRCLNFIHKVMAVEGLQQGRDIVHNQICVLEINNNNRIY